MKRFHLPGIISPFFFGKPGNQPFAITGDLRMIMQGLGKVPSLPEPPGRSVVVLNRKPFLPYAKALGSSLFFSGIFEKLPLARSFRPWQFVFEQRIIEFFPASVDTAYDGREGSSLEKTPAADNFGLRPVVPVIHTSLIKEMHKCFSGY